MDRGPIRLLLAISLFTCAGCSEATVDFSGTWEGSASLTVDGEQKNVALLWDLNQSEGDLGGTILWDNYRREITSASVDGPNVHVQSSTPQGNITFSGMYRQDKVEGRFAIQYTRDPEPFPGRFSVTRRD